MCVRKGWRTLRAWCWPERMIRRGDVKVGSRTNAPNARGVVVQSRGFSLCISGDVDGPLDDDIGLRRPIA